MSNEFRIERVFAAPRDVVWDAWTRPEQLAQWFGPKGTKATMLRAEVRPGGILHSRLETPDGVMFGRFVYRDVTPPSRLVWEHGFGDADGNPVPPPFPMKWPIQMLTTVVFADEGDQTRVTLTWVPLDASPEEERVFAENLASMNGGWSGSFDVLDEYLATKG
jgi:uncharacterized protein YndB with AHSA1/START domain